MPSPSPSRPKARPQMRSRMVARASALLLVCAVAFACAPAALAHVQVTPQEVAPGDSVHFRVLVPGENAAQHTTRVELQLPDGMHATAFADVPGWAREVAAGADGSPERVTWSGDLAPDGFVEFGLIATTPDEPKDAAWVATQTYGDGSVVTWSGAADAATPAPVTRIRANVDRQDAGAAIAGDEEVGPSASKARNGETAPIAAAGAGDRDGLARGIGLAGLALAFIALLVAVGRRRARRSPR